MEANEVNQTNEASEILITFFKDKNNRVLGRMPSRKYAIIDRNYKGGKIREDETWSVKITLEEDKRAIVYPLELKVSASENQKKFNEGIEQLKQKDWGERKNTFREKSYKKEYSVKNSRREEQDENY